MALILSRWKGEPSRLMPQELCPPPPPTPAPPSHEESRGLYKARARSQESVMRNRGDRILISSSCIVSKTVVAWCQ